MDITPQGRELSREEWWATAHEGDHLIDSNRDLRQVESPRSAPGRIAEVKMLASQEATRRPSQETSIQYASFPLEERQIYGSNENVYDPYNPLASREYRAQEVAAGRMEPIGGSQQSSRVCRELQGVAVGSLFTFSNRASPSVVSERDRGLPRMGTGSRRFTNEGSANHKPDTLSSMFDDHSHLFATPGELQFSVSPNSSEAAADPDSEELSALDFNMLSDTFASDDVGLLSSWGGSPSAGEGSLRSRRLRARDSIARAAGLSWDTSSTFPTPLTTIAATSTHQSITEAPRYDGLADRDRKRRRNDRSPQEAVPPPPVPGVLGATRLAARRAITTAAESPGRSRLRAEAPVFVPRSTRTSLPFGGHNIDLHRTLPENIRMTIHRHLDQQPTTTTTKISTATFLPARLDSRHLIFTSELIPTIFSKRKRRTILNILRTKAPYVPACIATPPLRPRIQYHYSVNPKQNVRSSLNKPKDAPLGSNGQGWPVAPYGGLPLEVFQNIASHLPRVALESMRLVNHEFERNVSNIQFRKVVVSFRPEIYDIIDPRGPLLKTADAKGNGKQKESPFESDETAKAVHDGMRVFEAWGSEVREFAMAFEVPDDQLARPPVKGKFEVFDAFFGSYNWPHPDYRRFELLCNLEKKADEHRYMSTALSNLQDIRVLGLCIDNGLGWLSGPDISDRVQVFKQKTAIFGARESEKHAKLSESDELWQGIVRSLRPEDGSDYRADANVIWHGELPMPHNQHGFYEAIVYPRGSTPRMEFFYDAKATGRPLIFQGLNVADAQLSTVANTPIDLLDLSQGNKDTPFTTAPIVPNKLTIPQKEWLMETEWAQRAFLSSYCMALTDNSVTFQHVHTLNIAKLSGKHLSAIERVDFWAALPNLSKLIMNVAADFRAISKDNSGEVVADDVDPSEAATQFFRLLKTYVSKVKNIHTISVGYCGGGERQTGIFGRNKSVLPAPLADYTSHGVFDRSFRRVLTLPHVRHLTLRNCWIAPPILKTFVSVTHRAKLRSLTLDSVSLSAHSGGPGTIHPDPPGDGVFARPIGYTLRYRSDPHLGDLFAQRDSYADPANADPLAGNLDSWVRTPARVGSWADVIDSISPGPTLDLIRYAFRYLEDAPPRRDPGALEVVKFNSCGYVRLVNHPADSFDQSCLPDVTNNPPPCLRKRALDLMPVMMHRNTDRLLGQIIPVLPDQDASVFATGFPMSLGWPGEEGLDALEDGQPMGGSARFSGRVEKLRFNEEW